MRGVLNDIGHNAHAGLWRINVGIANHELFQDVVLDRSRELLALNALLFAGGDKAGEDREHCTVHGHRHGHVLQWDGVEQDLHVFDRIDGDARFANVTGHPFVIGVVAAMGCKVERNRKALLPGGKIRAIESI